MAETEIAQPANFAIQVALAEQLARLRDHAPTPSSATAPAKWPLITWPACSPSSRRSR